MRLLAVWVHVLAAGAWWGGVLWQVLGRRPGPHLRPWVDEARRARPVLWAALGAVLLTGAYQLTGLGPLERALASGAAALLALKFLVVVLVVTLAAQRDFAHLPRLAHVLAEGADPTRLLGVLAWLDRALLVLGGAVAFLGVAVSRR